MHDFFLSVFGPFLAYFLFFHLSYYCNLLKFDNRVHERVNPNVIQLQFLVQTASPE